MFIIKLVLAYLIPDIPRRVRIALARERYHTRIVLEGQAPALDEYWNDSRDDASLFSEKGSLLLPHGYIKKHKAQ